MSSPRNNKMSSVQRSSVPLSDERRPPSAAVQRALLFRGVQDASRRAQQTATERLVDSITAPISAVDSGLQDDRVSEGLSRTFCSERLSSASKLFSAPIAVPTKSLAEVTVALKEVTDRLAMLKVELPEYADVFAALHTIVGQAGSAELKSLELEAERMTDLEVAMEEPEVRRARLILDSSRKSTESALGELENIEGLLQALKNEFDTDLAATKASATSAATKYGSELQTRTTMNDRIGVLYKQQLELLSETNKAENVGNAITDQLARNFELLMKREAIVKDLVAMEKERLDAEQASKDTRNDTVAVGYRLRPRIVAVQRQLEAAERERDIEQKKLDDLEAENEKMRIELAELSDYVNAHDPPTPAPIDPRTAATISWLFKSTAAVQNALIETEGIKNILLPIISVVYPLPLGLPVVVRKAFEQQQAALLGPQSVISTSSLPAQLVLPVLRTSASMWWLPMQQTPNELWSLPHTERKLLKLMKLLPTFLSPNYEAPIAAVIGALAAPSQLPDPQDPAASYSFLAKANVSYALHRTIAFVIGVTSLSSAAPDPNERPPLVMMTLAANAYAYATAYQRLSPICAAFIGIVEGTLPINLISLSVVRLEKLLKNPSATTEKGGGPTASTGGNKEGMAATEAESNTAQQQDGAPTAADVAKSARTLVANLDKRYVRELLLSHTHLHQMQYAFVFEGGAIHPSSACSLDPSLHFSESITGHLSALPLSSTERPSSVVRAAIAHYLDHHTKGVCLGAAKHWAQAPAKVLLEDAVLIMNSLRWLPQEVPVTQYAAKDIVGVPEGSSKDQKEELKMPTVDVEMLFAEGETLYRTTKVVDKQFIPSSAVTPPSGAPSVSSSYRYISHFGTELLVSLGTAKEVAATALRLYLANELFWYYAIKRFGAKGIAFSQANAVEGGGGIFTVMSGEDSAVSSRDGEDGRMLVLSVAPSLHTTIDAARELSVPKGAVEVALRITPHTVIRL